jgi:tetratricopeptide (TPR) repeat protein
LYKNEVSISMKITVSLFLLLSSFFAFGQNEKIKEDSLYYEKIITFSDSLDFFIINNLNQGIVSEKNINPMKQILKDYNDFLLKFPQSDYKFSVLNGKASTEFYLQKYDNAKNSYLEILRFVQENKELKDPFLRVPYSQDDRYLNYLYRNLANVEIKTKNYEQAIKYLDDAEKNLIELVAVMVYILK